MSFFVLLLDGFKPEAELWRTMFAAIGFSGFLILEIMLINIVLKGQ
jgi:hypothetical protein